MQEGIRKKILFINDLAVEHYQPENLLHKNPIIFIHGAFHGSWLFEKLQSYFAQKGWENFALNWRGHYLSKPVNDLGKTGLETIAEDFLQIIPKLPNMQTSRSESGHRVRRPDATQGSGRSPDLPFSESQRDRNVPPIDRRGFRSTELTASLTPQKEFSGLNLPILIGHSMGVLVSLKIAESLKTEKLVLLDGAPYRRIFLKAGLDKVMTLEGIESRFEVTEDYLFGMKKEHIIESFFVKDLMDEKELEQYISLACPESGKMLVDIFIGKFEVDVSKIKVPVYILGKATGPTGHRLNEMMAEDLKAEKCLVFDAIGHDMILQKDWEKYAGIIEGWIKE